VTTISWFPVAGDDELDTYAHEIWEKCEARIGFVPNVFRAYAWRGERFQRWLGYFNHVTRPSDTLGAAEREMIAVAVSMENGCLYCLVAHGNALREALDDPVRGETITLDWRRADLSAEHHAMLTYAVKVTTDPRRCSPDDIEHLTDLGFTVEDVWDIAEIAALYNATNRMAMAAGFVPNDCYHATAR
jgi:uncharacterized peroxidase-related enzyme